MLRRAKGDIPYRLKMKELFHRNILFAFNAFFYTYDPRKKPFHHIPFTTWDYEDGLILELQRRIENGLDLLIEKSRDMGATWSVLLTYLHFWLDPVGGNDFLCGSRIEDYVDKKGDPRTHFHKLRYAYYRLPKWLRPKGFAASKHDTHMKLVNPETGAAISGESNNPNFSTQGRYSSALFDEFAKWETTDEMAWTAAGDATRCRVALSTPFGAGGQYYTLAHDGKTKKVTLHWRLHPEKALGISCVWPPPNEADKGMQEGRWRPEERLTSPWYEKEKQRRRPSEIKQELDIDYIGAGSPVFDGKAGDSLRMYRELPDAPSLFLSLETNEMNLTPLSEEPLDPEGYFLVYEEYNPSHRYSVGVDVVEGVEGGDFAFVVALNRITKNVDGVYWSQVDEVILAKVIKLVSDYFSPSNESYDAPWVGIETNGPGLATFDLCVLLDMTNLFMAPRYDVTKGSVSYKKGWRTDTVSRNELVSGVRQYLIDRAGKINSQRIIGELLSFVRSRTGKPEAKAGCHDDAVFGLGIAIQVDEIAPLDYETIREARNPDLIKTYQAKTYEEEDLRDKEGPPSIYERCLSQALANQDPVAVERQALEEFYGGY